MRVKEEFSIGIDDIDINLELTNKSILKFMENAGSFHSDAIGFGLNTMHETLVAWALLDWKVQVLRRPKYGEKLTIETWSKASTKVFAYRDFYMYVGDELCAKGSSKWFLIDLKRRMPMRINNTVMEKYGIENISAIEINELEKFDVPEEYDNEVSVKVRRSDLDTSKHVHNLNYLDYANEAFNDDMLGNNFVPVYNTIRINYHLEMKYGDVVKVRLLRKDDIAYITILSEDGSKVHSTMMFS